MTPFTPSRIKCATSRTPTYSYDWRLPLAPDASADDRVDVRDVDVRDVAARGAGAARERVREAVTGAGGCFAVVWLCGVPRPFVAVRSTRRWSLRLGAP